ncbi:MAG: hypothetical protein JSV27_06450 [Candidatus Bathyarchaeota archaeon]|nr:MAG: hypothetical protein JSV27_06450 [Candidatus Bathyarchaeota archaeon]
MSVQQMCPKCGGNMVDGELSYFAERSSVQSNMPFSGIPVPEFSTTQGVNETIFWEEKTGKKTGIIFKRDETRRMGLRGFRCTLCNYVELFTKGT